MTVAAIMAARAKPAPATDAAHRLAWWLAARDEAAFERLAAHAGISFSLIDRLLGGDVDPADDVAEKIARETEGAVMPADWVRDGPADWLARPGERPG